MATDDYDIDFDGEDLFDGDGDEPESDTQHTANTSDNPPTLPDWDSMTDEEFEAFSRAALNEPEAAEVTEEQFQAAKAKKAQNEFIEFAREELQKIEQRRAANEATVARWNDEQDQEPEGLKIDFSEGAMSTASFLTFLKAQEEGFAGPDFDMNELKAIAARALPGEDD